MNCIGTCPTTIDGDMSKYLLTLEADASTKSVSRDFSIANTSELVISDGPLVKRQLNSRRLRKRSKIRNHQVVGKIRFLLLSRRFNWRSRYQGSYLSDNLQTCYRSVLQ